MATQYAPHLEKHLDLAKLESLQQYIEKALKEELLETVIAERELTLVARKNAILDVLKFLRDDKKCQFKILLDICGVDYPERAERFDVVYHMLSVSLNQRIRIKIDVADGDSVLSAVEVFPSANWYERETYDMFGISFEGHPDLRRLLTDYGFEGWPLRKDFPVEGRVEVYYDEKEKRVAYKPVDLPQQYRHFDLVSEWQGMTGNAYLAEESPVDRNAYNPNEFLDSTKEEAK